MAKRHEENKDIRSITRIAKLDYSAHTIRVSRTAIIGIRTWGRIDYLTKYCGWYLIWDNQAKPISVNIINEDNDLPRRKVKKVKSFSNYKNK